MFIKRFLLTTLLSLSCVGTQVLFVAAALPQAEVDALNQIAKTMGANWTFDAIGACEVQEKAVTLNGPSRIISCSLGPDNTSHIKAIEFKRLSLSGVLPPELSQLPSIQKVDFAYNYLNGSIPVSWASLKLEFISVFANRLSGSIPLHLGNITSLTYLDLEANQFSGTVPSELGKLVNLQILRLSSNRLSGNLPSELSELKNLTNFRINDNNFNGTIPEFIQNWKQLDRLEIQGSGLKGPIPSSISVLEKLEQLKISDIDATNQKFPDLRNLTGLRKMSLRNCSISGEIPRDVWDMNLRILDLSFNKLFGEIPEVEIAGNFRFIFLTGNSLSGNIPKSFLRTGINVDLSYNNFTQQTPGQPACDVMQHLNLNLFQSFSVANNLSGVLPCKSDLTCHQYWRSFYINCGGDDVKQDGKTFVGDGGVSGGAATYYLNSNHGWGFSSTGDFMDDDDEQNKQYIASLKSSEISGLFLTARIAPLSLTYFGYCLQNGNYSVSLDFAEIQFTNDNTYGSLGRRMFDVYVQGRQVETDFNIEAEASGVLKPITRIYNASVTNHVLEIRFNWAGKGTTQIPERRMYGPLVSAISVVDLDYKPAKKNHAAIVAGIVVGSGLIILVLVGLGWRCHSRTKRGKERDFIKGSDLQTTSFTLKQIKAATNNFDPVNKIGEGGFGPVYKGLVADGTIIAVKQLSAKSRQGNREFLNEIGMISCLQHPNLVKIHGCCIEGDQLLLIYEYMENNSLASALFGREQSQLQLDWPTRQKICLGTARGLAYLHEESRFKIVHRDIKATNILLDRDLNPKISDFGLAKLDEEENTHISTRIAGTIGYMAPEYALWGYLTFKADVYSFGVVGLEIVSGKHNTNYDPETDSTCLLDWACHLQQNGKVIEFVDPKLGSEYSKEEAERMIKISLLCTNASPSLRPTMSEVVSMLEGKSTIPDVIPEAGSYSQDLRFKALRDHRELMRSQKSVTESQSQHSTFAESHQISSPTSAHDLYEVNEESFMRYKMIRDGYKLIEGKNSDVQLSTSTPSWTASSSTSAHDLYSINSSS